MAAFTSPWLTWVPAPHGEAPPSGSATSASVSTLSVHDTARANPVISGTYPPKTASVSSVSPPPKNIKTTQRPCPGCGRLLPAVRFTDRDFTVCVCCKVAAIERRLALRVAALSSRAS
jgi:hypothetical protein